MQYRTKLRKNMRKLSVKSLLMNKKLKRSLAIKAARKLSELPYYVGKYHIVKIGHGKANAAFPSKRGMLNKKGSSKAKVFKIPKGMLPDNWQHDFTMKHDENIEFIQSPSAKDSHIDGFVKIKKKKKFKKINPYLTGKVTMMSERAKSIKEKRRSK